MIIYTKDSIFPKLCLALQQIVEGLMKSEHGGV